MPTTVKLCLSGRKWLARLWERDLRFNRIFLPDQHLFVGEAIVVEVTVDGFAASFLLAGEVRAETVRRATSGVEAVLAIEPRQVSALEAYLNGFDEEALLLVGGEVARRAVISAVDSGSFDALVARVSAVLVRSAESGGDRSPHVEPPLERVVAPTPPSTGTHRGALAALDQLFNVLAEDAATRRRPVRDSPSRSGTSSASDLELIEMVATSTTVEARSKVRSATPEGVSRGTSFQRGSGPERYTRVRELRSQLATAHDLIDPEHSAIVPQSETTRVVSEAEQRVAKETVAAMAHRFNSLLGAVVLGAKTLQGDLEPSHPLAEVASQMADSALQAGALAEALLGAVGRRLPPDHGRVRSPFQLNRVVSEALDRWDGFPSNVRVVIELDPSVGPMRGQREQVTLALHDVFASVVDAMPRGGDVLIETRSVRRGRRWWGEVTVEYTSGLPVVDVTSSPVVPWTASVRSGKGLGLAVLVGMAANHGGKVEIEHVTPNTVRITVGLPNAPVSRKARSTGRRPRGGDESVLIVDDEPQIRKLGRRLLEKLGYNVSVAANGQAALDLLEDPGRSFDLIVLDLTMPGMSTPELFTRLKTRLPDVKVILFTGCDLDSTATDLLDRGADAFLQKPDGASSLPKVVRRLLDGRSIPRE